MAQAIPKRMDAAELSRRVLSLLDRVESRASVEDVHRLRTTIRRLEVQLGAGVPGKVAKSLKALRRKAGKVRDVDVHLALLKKPLSAVVSRTDTGRVKGNRNAEIDPAQEELLEVLKRQRRRQLAALRERLAELSPRLRSRLPGIVEQLPAAEPSLASTRQKADHARQQYLEWTSEMPGDDATLHQLRIRAKKLRYALEPLQEFDEAAALVASFKKVQDDIGLWHDWLTLEQLATRSLDPAEAADFLKALHARCASQHRHALRTVGRVRRWMSGARKPVVSAHGPFLVSRSVKRVG